MRTIAALFFSLAFGSIANAHSGGLNSEGCHNNRKTGDYHCHRAAAPAQPSRTLQQGFFDSAPSIGGGSAYRNCTAARAAGAAPVYIGEPGYGPHLDRDGDGIGCE